MKIKVSLMGRFYPVTRDVPQQLDLPEGALVGEAIRALQSCAEIEASLMPQTLLAISGEAIGILANHQQRTLLEGDELVLFSPVAGG